MFLFSMIKLHKENIYTIHVSIYKYLNLFRLVLTSELGLSRVGVDSHTEQHTNIKRNMDSIVLENVLLVK